MTELRLWGVAIGLIAALYAFLRFRRGGLTRFDFALGMGFAAALLVVSLFPGAVTVLRDMLALEKTQFSRLLAIAIFSNLLLWFLVIHGRGAASVQQREIDHLVRFTALERFKQAYPKLIPLPPITVIIPAFNEAGNIGHVLAELPDEIAGRALTAIVIDDGSTDGTAEKVQEHGYPVVASPIRRGGGAALRIGFDIARCHGAEIAVTMDGDGQHQACDIEGLVTPILEGRRDIVIGSRLLGSREKDSLIRLWGIHVFNALIRLLTPIRITDCSNGFRAIRLASLEDLDLRQNQYHTSELIIEAGKKGRAIGEAPVTVKLRLSGSSKKGGNWKYGFRFALTIIRTWWR